MILSVSILRKVGKTTIVVCGRLRKTLRKKDAKQSKKLDRAPKCSILGLKTWDQGEGSGSPGPLDPII